MNNHWSFLKIKFISIISLLLFVYSAHNASSADSIPVIIELNTPCGVEFLSQIKGNQKSLEEETISLKNHLNKIEMEQNVFISKLIKKKSFSQNILFKVQKVFNGIGVYLEPECIHELEKETEVKSIHLLARVSIDLAYSLPFIGAPYAWSQYRVTGKGIKIGIIDTGIDYIHKDFGGSGSQQDYSINDPTTISDGLFPTSKIAGGYDFVGENYDPEVLGNNIPIPDPDPFDQNGHGTHVAGIIGGYGVLNSGATYTFDYTQLIISYPFLVHPGVAPKTELYALKIFSKASKSEILIPAIEWAIDPNQDGDFSDHLNILNLSLGEDFGFSDTPEAIACNNASKIGVVVVVSAGNRGDAFFSVGTPASAESVIAVSACEDADPSLTGGVPSRIAYFSSRGPSIYSSGRLLLKPDISAPGVHIRSANLLSNPIARTSSGTSMSAPHITGLSALLKEMRPNLTAQEIKTILINNATLATYLYKTGESIFAPPQVGGIGRNDFSNNIVTNFLFYDKEYPEAVSLTFKTQEISESTTEERWIRAENRSQNTKFFKLTFIQQTMISGVNIEIPINVSSPVNPASFFDFPVILNVDVTQLKHNRDPSLDFRYNEPYRSWLSEHSGIFLLEDMTNNNTLHLPFYTQIQPVSDISLYDFYLDFSTTNTDSLRTEGKELYTGDNFPNDFISFLSFYELKSISKKQEKLPDYLACADIQYLGITDNLSYLSETNNIEDAVIYFLVSTFSSWSSPNQVRFTIYIDTNNDGKTDYSLYNSTTYSGSIPPPSSDVFVSVLSNLKNETKIQYPLNAFRASEFDTNLFKTNVMVLAVRASDLNLSDKNNTIGFFCESSFNKDIPIIIDQVPEQIPTQPKKRLIYNLKKKSLHITSEILTDVFSFAKKDIPITISILEDNYFTYKTSGLLAFFTHNKKNKKLQFIPIITSGDTDNDTIPDVVESISDTDEDGIPDLIDLDSDNDGIPDNIEGTEDRNNNGVPDYIDPEPVIEEGNPDIEGELEGLIEGPEEGVYEGLLEGIYEGEGEEIAEGNTEGLLTNEGTDEGLSEGILSKEGEEEGIIEGNLEGEIIPYPPYHVTATDGLYSEYVLIEWKTKDNDNKYEFEVLRGIENDCTNATSIGVTSHTYFLDYTAEAPIIRKGFFCFREKISPVVYYYWIRAREKNGTNTPNWSDCSIPDKGWRGK